MLVVTAALFDYSMFNDSNRSPIVMVAFAVILAVM